MEIGLPLIMALVLSFLHFLGEEIDEYIELYREKIVSFGSGVSIAYIFVQLLPVFHRIASKTSEIIFTFPLIGFSSVHLSEKYLAKSEITGEDLRRDYAEIHSTFLFIYHAAIGYLISSLLSESAITGALFFLPIMLHIAISSISVSELHEEVSRRMSLKLLISIAPIIGVLAHKANLVSIEIFNPVFGAVTGMFFYIVIRDSIPSGDKGQPFEYLIGTVAYLGVILGANLL